MTIAEFYKDMLENMDKLYAEKFDPETYIREKWEDHKQWVIRHMQANTYDTAIGDNRSAGGVCPTCKYPRMLIDLPSMVYGICWDCKNCVCVGMGDFIEFPIDIYAKNMTVYYKCTTDKLVKG
jgi:hypothetical protein